MAGLAITGYKYSLSVSTNNGSSYGGYGGYILSSWTSGTSFVIPSLTNGYLYKIKIRAVNSLGDGAESEETSAFKPNTVPSTPSAATLTAGDAVDTFTWTAPASNGSIITKYAYQISADNGSTWRNSIGGTLNAETETANLSVTLSTQYSLISYKLRVRAFNNGTNGGWSSYSTISTGTVVWVSGGASLPNPTACPAPTCSACTAPTCDSCGSCASCDGGCDGCGTRSVTGTKGSRTATAGTRAAATLGTSSRTCYRWTRSGSTASDYVYNENSTDSCSSAYSTCTAGTCGACSAGSCSDCPTSTCGCSSCSDSFVSSSPVSDCVYATGYNGAYSGYYSQNFLGSGFIWYGAGSCGDASGCGSGVNGTLDMRYCGASGQWRAYGFACVELSCC